MVEIGKRTQLKTDKIKILAPNKMFYLKLDHLIMQFERFHWLRHHGLLAIINTTLYKYAKHIHMIFWGHFYFNFSLVFYILVAF